MSEEQGWPVDGDVEESYEWGYRLADGHVEWQIDYGTDGSWTSYLPDLGIPNVDIYPGQEFSLIRAALDGAGYTDAVVIKRKTTLTRSDTEMVLP